MVDWGRLLSGYAVEKLHRRFESCSPRQFINKKPVQAAGFLFWSKFGFTKLVLEGGQFPEFGAQLADILLPTYNIIQLFEYLAHGF